jgi:hypothetical protein
MSFRKFALGAVSASGILLTLSTVAPNTLSLTNAALAETNVSVNFGFGSFYNRLERYGSWVYYQDQYVFLPHHVDHGWRPYTLGHWSFTQRYGWMWVSNERFGWATYHYGRWGYSREIGWYWVPGRRWAPAWVAWSHGNNEVAWAPLPPERSGGDVNVTITIGDVPDYYWQAVPTSAFLSINLSDRIIRDRNQVRTIVQQNPPQTVRIENNIVINNAIQANDIEKATNTKVVALTEKPVDNPDAVGKTDSNSIAIFNPDVKVDANAKPKKAVKVEQVITDRKAQGIQPMDAPSDQVVVPGQGIDKNAQPTPPAVQNDGKVDPNAKSKLTTDAPVENSDKSAVDGVAPKVDAQGKVDSNKKKDSAPVVTPVEKPPVVEAPASEDPTTKIPDANAPVVDAPAVKPKQEKAPAMAPADAGKSNADGSVKKPKADDKGKVKCDPAVETCPPAQ